MDLLASDEEDFVTANSYVTMTEADDMISDASWLKLEDKKKVQYLINGSIFLGTLQNYRGFKTDPNQNLDFPRGGKKTIPYEIKLATCKLVENLIKNTAFGDGVIAEKVGSTYLQYNLQKKHNQEVLALVRKYKTNQFRRSNGRC